MSRIRSGDFLFSGARRKGVLAAAAGLATAACGIGPSGVQTLGAAPYVSASPAVPHCRMDKQEMWGSITLSAPDVKRVASALRVTPEQVSNSYYGPVAQCSEAEPSLLSTVDVADKSNRLQHCLVWAVNPTHAICPTGDWQ